MYQRIGGFRYTRSKPRSAFIKFFKSIADEHSFKLVSKRNSKLLGLSKDNLNEAAMSLGNRHLIREMEVHGSLYVSPARLARLSKTVPVTNYLYENEKYGIRLDVGFAVKNEFRCISIEIWRAKRLKQPGGFVTITAPREEGVSEILAKIATYCGWFKNRERHPRRSIRYVK